MRDANTYRIRSVEDAVRSVRLALGGARSGAAETELYPRPARQRPGLELLEASSADAVREAMTRAGLQFDRITGAVSTETDPFRGGIDR